MSALLALKRDLLCPLDFPLSLLAKEEFQRLRKVVFEANILILMIISEISVEDRHRIPLEFS